MNRPWNQIIIHFSFWAFMYVFMLDYFLEESSILEAAICSGLEILLSAFIVYINLYVLIPISQNKQKEISWLKYVPLLIALVGLGALIYKYSGAEVYLSGESTVKGIISFGISGVLFALISFLYWYMRNYQRAKEETMQMEREKLQMEIAMLKSQVSPHFLFNSFNNIYSLTVAKSDDAPMFVNCLAEILRYLIYEGDKERVPLSKELNLIERYIELEELKKTKGTERIKYTCDGNPDQLQIVPLLVINIVDNAFKHGDLSEEGFIHFDVKIRENVLELKNTNTTKKMNLGEGVGLTNLKNQLAMYYPGQHSFSVELNDNIFSLHLKIEL